MDELHGVMKQLRGKHEGEFYHILPSCAARCAPSLCGPRFGERGIGADLTQLNGHLGGLGWLLSVDSGKISETRWTISFSPL